MGTAVVRRHHLYVSVLLLPITVLELDPYVRETHSVAVAGKVMVLRPRGNLFRRPIGSAGAVGPPSVPLLQEVLVLAFELVVEDDALDVSALVTNLRLDVAGRAVDLGVVGQLARLLEARVERLPRLASVLTPIRFEGGLAPGPLAPRRRCPAAPAGCAPTGRLPEGDRGSSAPTARLAPGRESPGRH